ncbi:MAG: SRPBCC family protein [Gemmatimonadaceae bacterium]|nr:SRPBCC family protein [Chitinophagaceae bacterium]
MTHRTFPSLPRFICMAIHTLQKIQIIPAPIQTVWDFFATPINLAAITPKNLRFKILTPQPIASMHEGQILEYNVYPFLGIPLYWKTIIRDVDFQKRFADEQVKGPYKKWYHEHLFRSVDQGTEMTDNLSYELPLGVVGEIAHGLLVKNQVREIFDFRYDVIAKFKW